MTNNNMFVLLQAVEAVAETASPGESGKSSSTSPCATTRTNRVTRGPFHAKYVPMSTVQTKAKCCNKTNLTCKASVKWVKQAAQVNAGPYTRAKQTGEDRTVSRRDDSPVTLRAVAPVSFKGPHSTLAFTTAMIEREPTTARDALLDTPAPNHHGGCSVPARAQGNRALFSQDRPNIVLPKENNSPPIVVPVSNHVESNASMESNTSSHPNLVPNTTTTNAVNISSSLRGGRRSRADNSTQKWEIMFNCLVKYKQQHGDCDVPSRWGPNKKLASWVTRQRMLYRRKMLTADRIHKLDELGFTWDFSLEKYLIDALTLPKKPNVLVRLKQQPPQPETMLSAPQDSLDEVEPYCSECVESVPPTCMPCKKLAAIVFQGKQKQATHKVSLGCMNKNKGRDMEVLSRDECDCYEECCSADMGTPATQPAGWDFQPMPMQITSNNIWNPLMSQIPSNYLFFVSPGSIVWSSNPPQGYTTSL